MRKRIWILGGLVLIICVLIVLRRTSSETSSPVRAESSKAVGHAQPPQVTANSPAVPIVTAPLVHSDDSNAAGARVLTAWQAPIDFYGKVVDENSNAVVGASISFHWFEEPTENGNKSSATESDGEGLFSLHGARGPSLSVSVNKEGYYTSGRGLPEFRYGSFANQDFSPDPLNPIVFHLRKKGTPEPLIHVAGMGLRTMRDFLLAPDGKPTEVSLRDGSLTPQGQGDLKVEFYAGQPLDNSPSKMSWRCRVTIPGGGLIRTDDEFPFLAPETGYKETDEWNIGSTNWTERVNSLYYVKLRDGNFGRINVRVTGVPGKTYFRMESFLNPSGSRNLEPAN